MEDENGSSPDNSTVPTGVGEMPSREAAANKAKDFLSTRSRFVAAAVVAVVWGLLTGEAKTVTVSHDLKRALIMAGILSLIALVLDYCQYLFEFFDAQYTWGGNLFRFGRWLMFSTKQLLTFASTVTLVCVAVMIVLHASDAVGARRGYGIWIGQVWDDQHPEDKSVTELHLTDPDPYTKKVSATKDNHKCTGYEQNDTLDLLCGDINLKLYGPLEKDKAYTGKWFTTDSTNVSGTFSYQFKKWWEP